MQADPIKNDNSIIKSEIFTAVKALIRFAEKNVKATDTAII